MSALSWLHRVVLPTLPLQADALAHGAMALQLLRRSPSPSSSLTSFSSDCAYENVLNQAHSHHIRVPHTRASRIRCCFKLFQDSFNHRIRIFLGILLLQCLTQIVCLPFCHVVHLTRQVRLQVYVFLYFAFPCCQCVVEAHSAKLARPRGQGLSGMRKGAGCCGGEKTRAGTRWGGCSRRLNFAPRICEIF